MIPSYASGNSLPDPYPLLSLGTIFDPTWNYTGRVQVVGTVNPTVHTTVIITFGDSLAASTDNAAYSVTNSNIQDFSIQNGGFYTARTPALGSSDEGDPTNNGFWGHRLADKLINAGLTQRVVLVNLGIGSTGSQLWVTKPFLARFQTTFNRMQTAGLLAAKNVLVMSSLGGLDQTLAVSAATMTLNLGTIITAIRAAGFTTIPVYLALSSWASGSTGGQNGLNIRSGISQAITNNSNTFAGGDTDTIGLSGRYDTNHYNALGSDAAATIRFNIISGTL